MILLKKAKPMSLRIKVTSSHETQEKFTKGKDKLDFILSNQRAQYNKNGLGYQPNR